MDTHVYALRSWSIKKRGEEYFIAVTRRARRHKWRGPYGTLQRAAHAIARKLQWEFTRRHAHAKAADHDRIGREPNKSADVETSLRAPG